MMMLMMGKLKARKVVASFFSFTNGRLSVLKVNNFFCLLA